MGNTSKKKEKFMKLEDNIQNIQNNIKIFNDNFNKLFTSIVFLIKKKTKCDYLCKKGKNIIIYKNMNNDDLIKILDASLRNCECGLNKILESQKYKKGSLFSIIEIHQYIDFFIMWKKYCLEIENYFQRVENLFTIIKIKSEDTTLLNGKILNINNKSNNKQIIENYNDNFDKLFILIVLFTKKNESSDYLCKKGRYIKKCRKKKEKRLFYSIKKRINIFKDDIDNILHLPEYNQYSLFSKIEINQYIDFFKEIGIKFPEYNTYFQLIVDILSQIKKKDLNIEKSINDINNNNKIINNNGHNINIISNKYDIKSNNIENNIYSTNNNIYNNNNDDNKIKENNIQTIILLDKQKLLQAQDLELLNDNLGRALSSLECYANRQSGKQLSNTFNYYNLLNLGNTQNLNELQKKALVQTHIFKLAYEDYINNYKEYTLPENIGLDEIINHLIIWMNNVSDKDKFIYQGMINVFNSADNSIFDTKFNNCAQMYKNAKMDPKKISSFAPAVYYYNTQRIEEAKENFMEKGKITSTLNINKNYNDDKKAKILQKQIETNTKNYEEEEFDDFK